MEMNMEPKKTIKAKEFLKWANENFEDFKIFYRLYGVHNLTELAEQDDFFGTEGFNKRFS